MFLALVHKRYWAYETAANDLSTRASAVVGCSQREILLTGTQFNMFMQQEDTSSNCASMEYSERHAPLLCMVSNRKRHEESKKLKLSNMRRPSDKPQFWRSVMWFVQDVLSTQFWKSVAVICVCVKNALWLVHCSDARTKTTVKSLPSPDAVALLAVCACALQLDSSL